MSLLSLHRDDSLVAFGSAGERTRSQLLCDAGRIARCLPEPDDRSEVLLVFRQDRYAFAAALLAAWSRGHAVVLPSSTRRDAVCELADRSQTIAILHDTLSGRGLAVPPLLEGAGGPALAAVTPPPREHILTVYTSGTTGVARAFPKRETQLLGEAQVLARVLGIAPEARVVATVPPGHLYGLLFGVLVPLSCGAAFSRDSPFHPEAVAASVRRARANWLVTVPVHLRALSALEPGSLAALERVVSSTAPLPEPTARAFVERHGVPIREVFGSTETGGIAWREQGSGERTGGDARWRALPEVQLSVDGEGRLLVESPFVEGPAPYRTEDLVQLDSDGHFAHLGRADGVIKVGGRRESLPAIEAALRRLDGVQDAAVLALPEQTGRGVQVLAAIAGTSWTARAVRRALEDRFDPTCLPRRVRCVPSLPREETGKLQQAHVLRLFGLRPDGSRIAWALRWGAERAISAASEERRVFELEVPENCGWFDGHFSGYPILPAAVQLRDIVMAAVRRARPELGRLLGCSRMKFVERIRPADSLALELCWQRGAGEVGFVLRRGDAVCSSGQVVCALAEG